MPVAGQTDGMTQASAQAVTPSLSPPLCARGRGVLGRPLKWGAWSQEVAAGRTLVQVKLLPGEGHPYG